MKIEESHCQLEPLDRTIIHPETYGIAKKLLKHLKTSAEEIGTRQMVELTQNFDTKFRIDMVLKSNLVCRTYLKSSEKRNLPKI